MTDADLKTYLERLSKLALEVTPLGVIGLTTVLGELSHIIGYLADETRPELVEIRGDLNIAALITRAGMFEPSTALLSASAMVGQAATLVREG